MQLISTCLLGVLLRLGCGTQVSTERFSLRREGAVPKSQRWAHGVRPRREHHRRGGGRFHRPRLEAVEDDATDVLTARLRTKPSLFPDVDDTGIDNSSFVSDSDDAGMDNSSFVSDSDDAGMGNSSFAFDSDDTGMENSSLVFDSDDTGMENSSLVFDSDDTGMENSSLVSDSDDTGMENSSFVSDSDDTGMENSSFVSDSDDTGMLAWSFAPGSNGTMDTRKHYKRHGTPNSSSTPISNWTWTTPGDPRTGKELYMHVHIPKTGGTTLSNMMVCDLCNKQVCTDLREHGWESRCSTPCPNAWVDTELHCIGGPWGAIPGGDERREHAAFEVQSERAQALKVMNQAGSITFVTTLRPGGDRSISHWAHEMSQNPEMILLNGTFVHRFSNESLMHYISVNHGNWASYRNNLQVATLASVPDGTPLTRTHLGKAKSVLSHPHRRWKVGFTYCMSLFHEHLQLLRDEPQLPHSTVSLREVAKPSFSDLAQAEDLVPRLEHRTPSGLVLSPKVVQEVAAMNALDTELFLWALSQNDTLRFIGAGNPYCMGRELSTGSEANDTASGDDELLEANDTASADDELLEANDTARGDDKFLEVDTGGNESAVNESDAQVVAGAIEERRHDGNESLDDISRSENGEKGDELQFHAVGDVDHALVDPFFEGEDPQVRIWSDGADAAEQSNDSVIIDAVLSPGVE